MCLSDIFVGGRLGRHALYLREGEGVIIPALLGSLPDIQ